MTITGSYLKDREEHPRWWSSVFYWHQIQSEEEKKAETLFAVLGEAE